MTTLTQIQDEHNGNMVIKTQFPTTTQITGTPQKTNLLNRGSKYQEVFFCVVCSLLCSEINQKLEEQRFIKCFLPTL